MLGASHERYPSAAQIFVAIASHLPTRPAMRTRLPVLLAIVVSLALVNFRLTGKESASELRWFKGNLHTHSLWSDGNDYPEMIADWYKNQGYHFLALSDHNILSRGEKWMDVAAANKRGDIGGLQRYRDRFGDGWVELRDQDGKQQVRLKALDEFRGRFEQPGQFLMVQAEEITDKFEKLPVHINAHNLREVIRPQGGASVRETIANNLAAVEAQSQSLGRPILAHLNHPNFGYGVTAEDLAYVTAEKFFEVYNGHPGVNHHGDAKRVGTERLWDIANAIRLGVLQAAPLYGLATDDSHNYFGDRGSSPGRGWVMVRCDQLSPDALLPAMQRGEFYASSGVSLKEVTYSASKRTMTIEIDAVPGVQYTTDFIATVPPAETKLPLSGDAFDRNAAWIGKNVKSVSGLSGEYQLQGNELYVRAVVTANIPPVNPSFKGQKQQAWTQPVGWKVAK